MTTSILNDLLSIRNESPDKIQEYLSSINLSIFQDVTEAYPPLEAKQIILFIVTAYSEDSPLLIVRSDSHEEKIGICEYLGIPEIFRGKLIQLTDPTVRKATTQYIINFAGPLFKALKLIEIQLEDLNLAITNREYYIKPKDNESTEEKDVKITLYDWKEHSKAVQQYEILSKKKDALEKQLKDHHAYKAIQELKEYKFQHLEKLLKAPAKDGLAMESSKRIQVGIKKRQDDDLVAEATGTD